VFKDKKDSFVLLQIYFIVVVFSVFKDKKI